MQCQQNGQAERALTDNAVPIDNILAPHRARTLRRMQAHETVLCIQDGTQTELHPDLAARVRARANAAARAEPLGVPEVERNAPV